MTLLKPFAPIADYVYVGVKPIGDGPEIEIDNVEACDLETEKVDVEVFLKQHNMTFWINGYAIEETDSRESHVRQLSENLATSFKKKMQDLSDHVGLFKDPTCGYALVALEDFLPGQFALIYGGYQVPQGQTASSIYGASVDIRGKEFCQVDASEGGNFARFMQHLTDGSNYQFISKEIENKVAKKNLTLFDFSYEGNHYLGFTNQAKIPKGSLIGWDYGDEFWQRKSYAPILFYKNGAHLPKHCYSIKNLFFTIVFEAENAIEYVETSFPVEAFKNANEFYIRLKDGILQLSHAEREIILQQSQDTPYVRLVRKDKSQLLNSLPVSELETDAIINCPKISVSSSAFIREMNSLINNLNHLKNEANGVWKFELNNELVYSAISEDVELKNVIQEIASNHPLDYRIENNNNDFRIIISNPILSLLNEVVPQLSTAPRFA